MVAAFQDNHIVFCTVLEHHGDQLSKIFFKDEEVEVRVDGKKGFQWNEMIRCLRKWRKPSTRMIFVEQHRKDDLEIYLKPRE